MIIHKGIDRVNLGDFVQKVILMKPQQSRNSRGAIEQRWIKQPKIYGKLTINTADEMLVDGNVVNMDRIEFTTYLRSDVTAEYRVEIEGVVYAITSVARLPNQPVMVIKGEKIAER